MMKYDKLRTLVTISIIVGCVILYIMIHAIQTLDYVDTTGNYVLQYEAMISLCIGIVLTIVVFMIYPILYLRKANKIRLGIIK